MRAVRAFLIVVIALLMIGAISGAHGSAAEPTSTPTPDPCDFPNRLATAEAYSEAAAQYLELLEATPGLPCAQDGYIDAVEPTATQSPTATPPPFALADWLYQQGFETEAREEYLTAVKNTVGTPPPTELSKLDNKPDSFSDRAMNWSEKVKGWDSYVVDFVSNIGRPLVTIISILLVGLLLKRKPWRRGPELDIVPFEMGATGGSIGDALAESVQAIYTQINKGKPVTLGKLVISAEAETKTDIPAELTKGSAGVVLSLYNWISGRFRKTYRFTGSAIMDPAKGAGIILMLQLKNEVSKTETIWFRTFFEKGSTGPADKAPTSQDYLSLAETAAIVLHHWMTELDTTQPQSEEGSHYHTKWRNWESFARFRNSITALMWGDREQAIALLEESLFYDRWFLPARMNLATLKFQDAIEDKSAISSNLVESCARYKDALSDLHERGPQRPDDITLRMRLLYNYLAAIDYCVGWNNATFPDELNAPFLELRGLIRDLNEGETWDDTRFDRVEDRQRVVEPLDLLVKTIMIRADNFPLANPSSTPEAARAAAMEVYLTVSETDDPPPVAFGHIARYGNACLCAAAFHRSQDSRWADLGLNHLKEAVRLKPSIKKWAKVDPSLEPFRISNETSGKFFDLVHEPDPEPKKPERTEHVLLFGQESAPTRNTIEVQMTGSDD